MEPNTGDVRPNYLVPVEAKNYVFGFWRRHDCAPWAYYVWTVWRRMDTELSCVVKEVKRESSEERKDGCCCSVSVRPASSLTPHHLFINLAFDTSCIKDMHQPEVEVFSLISPAKNLATDKTVHPTGAQALEGGMSSGKGKERRSV